VKVFELLRVMGASAEPETAKPVRLSDPLGSAVTRALVAAKLWSFDTQLGLEREGAKVSISIFQPEESQSDREVDRIIANQTKALLYEILQAEGCTRVFIDAFWCERGRKGWSIVASLRDNREDRA
jgi:hypothetical protein